MFTRILLVALIALPATLPAQEKDKKDPPDERTAKAVASVEKKLEDMKGAGAKVEAIDEKFVAEVFPNHVFVAVRYPLWPVARVPAEPLMAQNLFAVTKDGKVTHLPDSKKLEEFFKTTLKTQLNQDKTTRTWLRLRME